MRQGTKTPPLLPGNLVTYYLKLQARIQRLPIPDRDDNCDRWSIGPGQYRPGRRWHGERDAHKVRHLRKKSACQSRLCLLLYIGCLLGCVLTGMYYGVPWMERMTHNDLQLQLNALKNPCTSGHKIEIRHPRIK